MKEAKSIIEAYRKVNFSTQKAALATVMRVHGSSYRRPGARMLMTDDGRWTGAISGGCLEGDALRKARQAILNNRPSLVTYDTMDDNSATSLGVGLGCNGIIDVLIEPINELDVFNSIHLLEKFVERGELAVLATVFDSSIAENPYQGQRFLLNGLGEKYSTIGHANLEALIAADAQKAFVANRPAICQYTVDEAMVEVLVETLHPGIQLVVFGGGFDAAPVTSMAKNLGWAVTVTDDCIAHLGAKRFPDAENVTLCQRDHVSTDIIFKRFSAAILMSHNYKYDYAVLKELIKNPPAYLGIMGPKKRFDKMVDQLKEEGIYPGDAWAATVHSPIGLDLGAETPDEIALSVIAEIQAFFNNSKGGYLKHLDGPIHDRSAYDDRLLNNIYEQLNASSSKKGKA
ncbi:MULTISPECIES: XdhC family protein [unclassified Imperialibacter]|uniref:XdhC family protein n=1 Tax=unclassified Imperialibacter TaxID=2629706 RepID=UPI001257E652|nr:MULTISPECIES: XdhC/CoxI family protein [unclassified Imperialibacter]CAD5251520.1 Xanthine dehydrogenase [Imperialibacter sp. 75]CAD5266110.1 Xanthine dehydrogenase [Imperialibacter sp. 89]VVT23622.1 Xanthine dehydrogenase [Imperialibacter sp. EC-SDR9]